MLHWLRLTAEAPAVWKSLKLAFLEFLLSLGRMSFPSSFGTQVAAIMDVLAKAAVAEITQLVENGAVVLRLEMCRRDSEIQELKRSLKLMEIELCNAREAALSRAPEDTLEQTAAGSQVPPKGEKQQLARERPQTQSAS